MGPGTVGDVVVDAHHEGIGLLEYHAHFLPEEVYIDAGSVDVRSVIEDLSFDPDALNQVVHAVEGFEERTLSAA